MLTEEGSAKVLDFGLAQTAQSTKLTRMGSTLGTVAYMSPEQARGEEVDLKTDLWSLGAVLYEMVAGRSPFPGDYEQAVVYEILNQEPEPLTSLRTGVPMALEWLVTKLLAKSTDSRYQSATDLLVDLRNIDVASSGLSNISRASSPVIHDPRPSFRSSRLVHLVWAFVLLVFVAVTWLITYQESDTASIASTLTLIDESGLIQRAYWSNPGVLAISRDGSKLVVAIGNDETWQLYLREIDDFTIQPIQGTEKGRAPAFSPDGEWITFCDDSDRQRGQNRPDRGKDHPQGDSCHGPGPGP